MIQIQRANAMSAKSVAPQPAQVVMAPAHDAPALLHAVLGATVQRATADLRRLRPVQMLSLQKTIGNRAVGEMLVQQRAPASSRAGGAPGIIQAKLTVGPANDVYEQEADRIARTITQAAAGAPATAQRTSRDGDEDRVARMPAAVPTIRRIQRAAPIGAAGGTLDAALEQRLRRSQGGGRPMPASVRRVIEPKLGVDLSAVKVHTGSDAVQLNRDLGAQAFTHGKHIYYGAGQSPHNLQLTAHEVVHTVQQGATDVERLQRKKKAPVVDPRAATQAVPAEANKFKLTLAVWQDDPNFLWKSFKFVLKKAFTSKKKREDLEPPTSTGHSWVELRAYKGDQMVFSDSYGFYRSGVSHPDSFHGDSGEDVLYRDYEISKDKFLNVIATAEKIAKENPKYDLKGMNCTKFARTLVLAAGLKFMGSRVVPGAKFGPGKAFTPNRLFSAMSRRYKKGKAYKLESPRKDLSSQQAPEREPVTLYMMPDGESPVQFPLRDPSQIVRHRVDEMSPGYSQVILMGEEGVEETWYARTADLKRFLSGGEEPVVDIASTLPFNISAVRAYVESEEWEMLDQQVGVSVQDFKNLTPEQVTYIAEQWGMSVNKLQEIIARAPA